MRSAQRAATTTTPNSHGYESFTSLFKKSQYLPETAGLIPELLLLPVVAMEVVPGTTVAAEATSLTMPTAHLVSVGRQIVGALHPHQIGLPPLPLPCETLVLVSHSDMEYGKMASTLLADASCAWKKSSLATPPTR